MKTQRDLLLELIESNKVIIDILTELRDRPSYNIDKLEFSTGGGCNIHLPEELKRLTDKEIV